MIFSSPRVRSTPEMPCTRDLFLVACLPAIITLLCYVCSRILKRPFPRTLSKDESPLEQIRSILQPPGAPISQLLIERSTANQRISLALGLTNTFVNPDPQLHADFVQHSRGLLRGVQTNGWTRFQQTCAQAVQSTLEDWPDSDQQCNIPFDRFVQIVVLRTILVGLLNVGKDVEELDYSSLAIVTALINDLWTLSKSGALLPSDLQQQLRDHLRRLIPISAGFENPIDFVVPTWETMWRVCATTIARIEASTDYQSFFHDFLQTDSLEARQFAVVGSQGFSVRDFVQEVMRLHPPVKRISRVHTLSPLNSWVSTAFGALDHIQLWLYGAGTKGIEDVRSSADVEAALRTETIWSGDAHAFNPRRHQSVSSQMKDIQQVVFGYGRLRCVAATWAPDAAAVISATIMEEVGESGLELHRGAKIGGRNGWDGWSLVGRA
ncbi:hypothetical protein NP233_g7955 [Leucocoprinus birnbaumii]|uniref:Cytochrome P450 n=1 Tax=Leucocoprinus birnbaumii TaxID=56174 RepID=A0AAD5YSA7_9AGAR|nr:hypothetical protein NP233_g7955 [Leucocoprinus birnbaumii]